MPGTWNRFATSCALMIRFCRMVHLGSLLTKHVTSYAQLFDAFYFVKILTPGIWKAVDLSVSSWFAIFFLVSSRTGSGPSVLCGSCLVLPYSLTLRPRCKMDASANDDVGLHSWRAKANHKSKELSLSHLVPAKLWPRCCMEMCQKENVVCLHVYT